MDDRSELPRGVRIGVGAGHLALGAGLGLADLLALPARDFRMDVPALLVALLLLAAGGTVLGRVKQGPLLARVAAAVALVVGLATLTALLWSASYLRGIYGDLGRGASAFFVLIAFTVLPYLVIYPGVALVLLRPARPAPTPAAEPSGTPEAGRAG